MKRCWAAIVLPLTLLAGCASSPGNRPVASPDLRMFLVHGIGAARPFDEYELQDLRTYAESSGTPLTEVLAGQRGSSELGELAAALEADPDSGFVMTGHDAEDPGTAFMTFTHRPTARVLTRLKALPLDTTVTFGLPLPHDELVRYSESLVGALDHLSGVQFISCGPTELGDAVDVRYAVTGTPPSRAALDAAARAATARWSTGGQLKVPVHFTIGSVEERLGSSLDATSGS